MSDEAPAPKPEVEDEDPDIVFDTLWARVLEAWDDDKPHNAVLDYALKAQRLPQLAGKYKDLKEDPAKGERAKKRMDGIVIAATQMMMAMKTPAREKTPWQWTASVAVIAALVCGWLFYKLFVRGH